MKRARIYEEPRAHDGYIEIGDRSANDSDFSGIIIFERKAPQRARIVWRRCAPRCGRALWFVMILGRWL